MAIDRSLSPARRAVDRQRSSGMPSWRYRAFGDRVAVRLEGRTWPDRRIDHAPMWCPVDLRDGNQALIDPMDGARKQRLFDLMVAMGFKEIEVGFASASQLDFDFVRSLIQRDAIPDDVTIVVLTPARGELIERTFAALEGVPRAIVHLYAATAPLWRREVLGLDASGLRRLIADACEQMARCVDERPQSALRLQYSPETFNLTEPEVVLDICDTVTSIWRPTPRWPVIINLPSTIESATPNVYADQIEWMDRHLQRRDGVVLSVHPHNDRGTGVAAAELALMAGAERVEGCLFGNGERTGNVCLVTLALNLHTQGVDPELDLSDIDAARRVVEEANRLPVHPRHPYAGDLVYSSFSGSHQDAINKVFAARERCAAATGIAVDEQGWEVPYLPVDPHDVGRNFEAVIRFNSQSGRGGLAYLLKAREGWELPRGIQTELADVVQARAEVEGELTADELLATFRDTYLIDRSGHLQIGVHQATRLDDGREHLRIEASIDGRPLTLQGRGTGPIDAFVAALGHAGIEVRVLHYVEHALSTGGDARAAAYVECSIGDRVLWGVNADASIVRASLQAVVSAVNRALR